MKVLDLFISNKTKKKKKRTSFFFDRILIPISYSLCFHLSKAFHDFKKCNFFYRVFIFGVRNKMPKVHLFVDTQSILGLVDDPLALLLAPRAGSAELVGGLLRSTLVTLRLDGLSGVVVGTGDSVADLISGRLLGIGGDLVADFVGEIFAAGVRHD